MLTQKEELHLSRDFSENIQQPFHPWRRFFARMFDYAWIILLFNILFSVILRIRPFANSWLDILLGFATPVLAIPIFAVMIHLWGTTPGKWLWGLSVVSENGNKMDFSAAKDREVDVFVRGYGLGLPVFRIVRLIMSYNFYRNQTPDLDDYVEYCYHDSKRSKIALLVIAVIILNVSNILINADAFLPKYRGDLTVAEFAENYNFYAKILDENNLKLERDGTFEGQYDAVVLENGKAGIMHKDFNYHTENGYIRSIFYNNTWTDIMYISPVGWSCEIASITAVMSQDGANIIDLFRIASVLLTTDKCVDGQINYKNVTVSWMVDEKNCHAVDGEYLIKRLFKICVVCI